MTFPRLALRRAGAGTVRRRLLPCAALGLALALVGAGAPAAPPAEAAAKARIVYTTVKGKVSGNRGFTYTIRKPVLKGSTARNRAFTAKRGNAFFAAAVKDQKRTNLSCGAGQDYGKKLTGKADAAIYKGRYASIVVKWSGRWCDFGMGETKSWTLDLRTGKTVSLSKFVSNTGNVFDWAVARHLPRYPKSPWSSELTLLPRSAESNWNRDWVALGPFTAWKVSNAGVRVYVSYDEDSSTPSTVPWKEILRPGWTKARAYTFRRVHIVGDNVTSSRATTTVTSRGQAVTVRFCYVGASCSTLVGLRTGRTAVLLGATTPLAARVTFAGTSTGARATKVEMFDSC